VNVELQGKGKSKAGVPVRPTSDADAIVAGIMAELEGRGPAPAAADALATTTAPIPMATPARVSKGKKVAATLTPVADEAPLESTVAEVRPAPKPKLAAKARSVVAAPSGAGVDIDDTFVPPATPVNGAAPMLTEQQQKAAVRAVQAAKAAEAEQRKRKLEERKVKKAEQVRLARGACAVLSSLFPFRPCHRSTEGVCVMSALACRRKRRFA
jgi:hypothetical protein